jgi:hypothetical protein
VDDSCHSPIVRAMKQGLHEVNREERTLRPMLHRKKTLLSPPVCHHHLIDPSSIPFIKSSGLSNTPSLTHERHKCRRGPPESVIAAPSQGASHLCFLLLATQRTRSFRQMSHPSLIVWKTDAGVRAKHSLSISPAEPIQVARLTLPIAHGQIVCERVNLWKLVANLPAPRLNAT